MFEQDNLVPTLTVAEIIRLARELKGQTVSDEEMSNIMNIIKLGGYEKRKISELSSGQAQRVALARLFFDDSKIIILDEATSAMDNITEKNVMHNILNKLKNKTIIIIAHRLETIKDVDNIFVLSDGKIVEEGKYLYLLEKNGYFKDLYKSSK